MDIVGFFDVITKPEATLTRLRKNANTGEAVKLYAIAGGIFGLLLALMVVTVSGIIGLTALTGNQTGMMGMLGGLGLLSLIVLPILGALFFILIFGFQSGLYFLVASLLGGKGTFAHNIFLNSRFFWPVFVVNIITAVLSVIPILGLLIQLGWWIYAIYLTVIWISIANGISKLRAFVVWLIPSIVILGILFLIFGAVLLATIGAAGANLG
ncbi:MAG: Yip1 family protein [Candidatus Diapherotrites archaeon]|nr:Yip1 family protein [Candidatus Diapherotrites archaeon]MDZ4256287.1 Yip1 family protein [archaeon]